VYEEAVKQRKQNRLGKAISNKDRGLNSFGITKKIQKIMREQQQRKKTIIQSHRQEEEEEELLAKEA